MVNTGELESFLNDRTAKDGDIVEITGEGSIEVMKKEGQPDKRVLNIPVKNDTLSLIYTPGKTALGVLQKAWGLETKNWTGKKFTVKLVLMQVGQKELNVIRPMPLYPEKPLN